jgi:hypothetical protein
MSDLTDRLRTATIGSVELDGLVERYVGDMSPKYKFLERDNWGERVDTWTAGGFGGYQFYYPSPVTTSLDAALALVDRKLPETYVDISKGKTGRGEAVLHGHGYRTLAASPALAVTLALVVALETAEADKLVDA